jgi:hypothetical protein
MRTVTTSINEVGAVVSSSGQGGRGGYGECVNPGTGRCQRASAICSGLEDSSTARSDAEGVLS